MLRNDIIHLLILLGIFIFVKKLGLIGYGRRKKVKSYIYVTENERRKIILTVKRKVLWLLERERTYELKYIKIKNSIEEVKIYFDAVLKDKEYLLREISSNNFFNKKKKATIYLRDSSTVFEKFSIVFLPETELKSLIQEMLELEIVELEDKDFATLTEKIAYTRLLAKMKK